MSHRALYTLNTEKKDSLTGRPAIDYILSFSISWQGGVSVDELSKFAMFSDQDLVIRPHCYYAIHPLYQIAPSVEAREHLMPGQWLGRLIPIVGSNPLTAL